MMFVPELPLAPHMMLLLQMLSNPEDVSAPHIMFDPDKALAPHMMFDPEEVVAPHMILDADDMNTFFPYTDGAVHVLLLSHTAEGSRERKTSPVDGS